MIRVECDQCGGYGFVPLEEDGGVVQHACYRCCTEGYHDYTEEQYVEMVNELLSEAAARDVRGQHSVDL